MDELILGRSFLHAIGFNLSEHLSQIHQDINGRCIEDLTSSPTRLSSISYKGTSYLGPDDDPIDIECVASSSFGIDSDADIEQCISDIVEDASRNEISDAGAERLKDMLRLFRDVLRIKLGSDPPARVEALSLKLKVGAKPFKSKQRRYSPEHRKFITQTMHELESIGAVYRNPSARWASPALVVPKPGTNTLRLTVDLRVPNSMTVPIQAAMPHLESRLQDTQGSTCYANIDMAHAYW